MKKLSLLLIIFVLSLFAVSPISAFNLKQYLYSSECEIPIKYRIDTVDPKFKVTKEKFLEKTNRAAEIWNKAYGKELFKYDEKGELSINFIYDNRQALNSQINNLEGKLEKDVSDLQSRIAQYKKDSEALRARFAALNSEIEEWNKKGGAPQNEFDRLNAEKENLLAEAAKLNERAASLDLSAEQYNTSVGTLNNVIENFNAELSEKPEEGVYIGKEHKIEIYFNNTEKELIHTLAHELGHARGMEHISDKSAIMYSFSTEDILPTEEEISQLKYICRDQSVWERIVNRINLILEANNLTLSI